MNNQPQNSDMGELEQLLDYIKVSYAEKRSVLALVKSNLAAQDITSRIDEVKERGDANTKLSKLLTEIKHGASKAPGLSPGEKQVVLMAESQIRRHYQEVERLRIKDRLSTLTAKQAEKEK